MDVGLDCLLGAGTVVSIQNVAYAKNSRCTISRHARCADPFAVNTECV